MKILQISTPVLSISPDMKYGGTERVIRDLDSEYMRQGHESVVIAPGNSVIDGKLVTTIPQNTWKPQNGGFSYDVDRSKTEDDFEAHCKRCLEIIVVENPDAIHDHTKLIASKAYMEARMDLPLLTTFHGDLNDRSLSAIDKIQKVRRNGINFFGAISESQKSIFKPYLSMDFMVYNALNTGNYPFQNKKKNYLFSIGKIDRHKGQDTAIKVAKDLGEKLVMAGPVHVFRNRIREFWENEVEPQIDRFYGDIPVGEINGFIDYFEKSDEQIIHVGEINDRQKQEWFKYSKGFLMPIRWREPFGLVMIESMACGTPVVAYNLGAVPEIITDSKTGYIVEPEDFEGFLYATKRLEQIDPYECRKSVVNSFDISRQADDYIKVFNEINGN